MRRLVLALVVIVSSATAAAAQPAAEPPPPPPPTATPPAPAAPPATAPTPTREACTKAINETPEWKNDLIEQLKPQISSDFYAKLDKDSHDRHEQDSILIARNHRHVVMAYAALWVLSIGFLLYLWRRQQRLTDQIGRLQHELEAALKADKDRK